ncbi:MAG: NAD-dependent epimerase/dehydratase family protein [Elusimicrobia bacterium]|nr:NAD-dependent epimerase/dehydratase family protein [Elusimicrobiota bacterium]
MKLLILGGTRFFGRELALRRAAAGDQVTVFSRRCPCEDLPRAIRQIPGDRKSASDMAALSGERWDAVVDNICFSEEDVLLGMETAGLRAGLWIMVSTGDVHLAVKGAKSPFTEDQCARLTELPQDQADPYGFGKLRAEKALLSKFRGEGFPAVIARFPIVIGPRDPKLRAYSYWLRMADGHPVIVPDGGAAYRRYIWSSDAARALETLMLFPEKSVGETFHFGESAPLALSEWLDISAALSGVVVQAADISSEYLSAAGYDLACSPYWTARDYVLGISKAENVLGWRSTPIRQWMEDAMSCYFEDYDGPKPGNYACRAKELELISRWLSEGGRLRPMPLGSLPESGGLLK